MGLIFPKAKFVISMDIPDLDRVLSEYSPIVVTIPHNCYCYDGKKNTPTKVRVNKSSPITVRDAIKAIIEAGYDPSSHNCTHVFLEDIKISKSGEFTADFGS
jgi:hypothetical protein